MIKIGPPMLRIGPCNLKLVFSSIYSSTIMAFDFLPLHSFFYIRVLFISLSLFFRIMVAVTSINGNSEDIIMRDIDDAFVPNGEVNIFKSPEIQDDHLNLVIGSPYTLRSVSPFYLVDDPVYEAYWDSERGELVYEERVNDETQF
jgi:hypothetical protein